MNLSPRFVLFFSYFLVSGAASPSRVFLALVPDLWLRGLVLFDCTLGDGAPFDNPSVRYNLLLTFFKPLNLSFNLPSAIERKGGGKDGNISCHAEIENTCNVLCPHETAGSTWQSEECVHGKSGTHF